MKNCIMLWKNDAVDLAINNQRRAFSDAYNNEVLAESKIYIELSSKNPLSKLSSLETEDLKNTPCILVINQTGQQDTACKEPGSCQKNIFLGIYIIILLAFFTLLINHCCQNDIYQNRHHTVHRIGC